MQTTVSATELAKHLSDILNRVRYRREEFVIQRNGEQVARLSPAGPTPGATLADLARRLAEVEWPDDKFADDIEAARQTILPVEPPEWPS